MKAKTKKDIESAKEMLTKAKELLENARDEEQDAFDRLSEAQQDGEKGEALEENIDNLGLTADTIDEALDYLKDVKL